MGENAGVGDDAGLKSGVGDRSELEGVALGAAGPFARSLKSAADAKPIRTAINPPSTPTRTLKFNAPLFENRSSAKCSRRNYSIVVYSLSSQTIRHIEGKTLICIYGKSQNHTFRR